MHRSLLLLCVLLALFVHAMSCPYPVPDEIKAKHFHPSEVPASKVFTTANKEITLAVNDKFMINLEGNPTTGYSWRALTGGKENILDALPEQCSFLGCKYERKNHEPGMVGGGGTEHWGFQAMKPGKFQLQFQYVRPWMKNEEVADESFTITVQ